jgi:hypothetical protein
MGRVTIGRAATSSFSTHVEDHAVRFMLAVDL